MKLSSVPPILKHGGGGGGGSPKGDIFPLLCRSFIRELPLVIVLEVVYRGPKKVINRKLLEPRCTGSVTRSRQPLCLKKCFLEYAKFVNQICQTKPNLPIKTYQAKLILPNQTYQKKPKKTNQPYQTKLTIPNLPNQTYQTKPYKIYPSKPAKPNLPSQANPTKSNLPIKT